ncbi:MAG TPA: PQQ-dependent sugar dehydrogenase [Aggregatilineales bacterium]|nr:PQQ-dependent sugar dehydrogenase [Aggregatilineales bacterium]
MHKAIRIGIVLLTLLIGSIAAPRVARGEMTFQLDLEPVGTGFNLPVYLTNSGDGTGRLFVVEKPGRIMLLKDGKPASTPFLDITALVQSQENERGLLGLAFHPQYRTNGLFFVYYTDLTGQLTIARYKVSSDNPNVADPKSARLLITVKHLLGNHNGGSILFGPDGYLYFGMGDGGGGGDPYKNGQNTTVMLGKISRIDVDHGDPYAIPKDNPFASGSGGNRPEIWFYGLRNPWRFSFDRASGDLFIADVGQDLYEEVDFVKAGTPGGLNLGWSIMEGLHCYNADSCAQTGLTLPVVEYSHDLGCSVIGGYVYRGTKFPKLVGNYFYSDECTARIWALRPDANGKWTSTQVFQGKGRLVSSFGQDEAGELYLIDLNGGTIEHLIDRS